MADKYVKIHQNPQGPGDRRPTALGIVNDEGLAGKWSDKTIMITGASAGLGVETAKALATTNARLFLTARDITKARKALGDLADSPRVQLLQLDLNSLQSVRACAEAFHSASNQLSILICNAGVMNTPEGRTADGFETQFGTNHLAHFLLINLLLPTLLSSATPEFNSRVVILASIAHRFGGPPDFSDLNFESRPYDTHAAYSQSKTANLWTANHLERLYGDRDGDRGVHAWSVQPGGVATDLMRHMSDEERGGVKSHPELSKIFKSPEQGAATTVWAATAQVLEGEGGRYLEDCQVARPWTEENGMWGQGHGAHAYDPEGEERLWRVSREMVGLDSGGS